MKPYSANKKLKVIEMLGGPGSGKSASSLILAGQMKARGFKVEHVREFPKDLVWDGRNNDDHSMFTEQDYILAHQNNLYRRMLAHDIEYIVTDTSILLGLIYLPDDFPRSFSNYLIDVYQSYDNITFYVDRGDIPYVEAGRNQNEDEAHEKDRQALELLKAFKIDYKTVSQRNGDYDHVPREIFKHILDRT